MTLRGVHRFKLPQLASLSLESNKEDKLPKSYLASFFFSLTVDPLVLPHTLCRLELSSLFKCSAVIYGPSHKCPLAVIILPLCAPTTCTLDFQFWGNMKVTWLGPSVERHQLKWLGKGDTGLPMALM